MDGNRTYICIDLKSFYASVECVERKLDPLNINLVVADSSRTSKTICLAVTPALKSYGISGRARLFEVEQTVKKVNNERKKTNNNKFTGESYNLNELKSDSSKKLTYLVATPRMALYVKYSTKIYGIYLKYIAKEDIHVYSIDEVFIDVTKYLSLYNMTAHELAVKIIKDVLKETGITATAGIGTNMYLAKVAMDIVAKHVPADSDGVRVAELDEMSYREKLWNHKPLTDFWRVGKGYAKKLKDIGCETMGDIARYSLKYEDIFYSLFGINAELLIDHAWGYEPTTIEEIKKYKPDNKSTSTGQVLHEPYNYEDAKLIVKEMADQFSLDLLSKKLVTNTIVLSVGYDIDNDLSTYKGEIVEDYLGRTMPKPAHSTIRLSEYTSSTLIIVNAVLKLYEKIVNKNLLIRRINIGCNTINEDEVIKNTEKYEQLNLFKDYENEENNEKEIEEKLAKEKNLQETVLKIKGKYGKNSIVKGMNLEEKGTTIERNKQIGGHKA